MLLNICETREFLFMTYIAADIFAGDKQAEFQIGSEIMI